TGKRYAGSLSWFALPMMAEKLGLPMQTAWDTRHQHRELWKSTIDEFRKTDSTRLLRMALEKADILAGVRDVAELKAGKETGLILCKIGIDRPGTPVDAAVTYGPEDCDLVLKNDKDLPTLYARLGSLCYVLGLVDDSVRGWDYTDAFRGTMVLVPAGAAEE